jgi:hypothetical protein
MESAKLDGKTWSGNIHWSFSTPCLIPHTKEKCVLIHRGKHWATTTPSYCSMNPSVMCHTHNINSKIHYLALVQQSFWYALPTESHLPHIETRLVPSMTAACSDLCHWERVQSQPLGKPRQRRAVAGCHPVEMRNSNIFVHPVHASSVHSLQHSICCPTWEVELEREREVFMQYM